MKEKYWEGYCLKCGNILVITKERFNEGSIVPIELMIPTSNCDLKHFSFGEILTCKCGGYGDFREVDY